MVANRNLLFQGSFFKAFAVSFREGTPLINYDHLPKNKNTESLKALPKWVLRPTSKISFKKIGPPLRIYLFGCGDPKKNLYLPLRSI